MAFLVGSGGLARRRRRGQAGAMLERFAEEIWIAPGGEVATLGFRYPTRMVVMRLGGGALVLWSPVLWSRDLHDAVAALGEVGHVIAPSGLHHLFVSDWLAHWPGARLHVAPGLRRKRPDLAAAVELGDMPDPAWAGEIGQVVLRGNRIATEVVFHHVASRTAIFTDMVQSFPAGWFRGWRAVVARMDAMVGPEPRVPRKFRLATTNRAAARQAIARIAGWDVERVLMAHGAPVERDGAAHLDRAFRWLTG